MIEMLYKNDESHPASSHPTSTYYTVKTELKYSVIIIDYKLKVLSI